MVGLLVAGHLLVSLAGLYAALGQGEREAPAVRREAGRAVDAAEAGELLARAAGDVLDPHRGLAALEELLNQAIEGWWSIISSTPKRRLVTYEIATGAVRGGGDVRATALTQYRLNTRYVTTMIASCADVAGVTWSADVEEVGLLAMNYLDGYVLRWLLEPDSPHLTSQRRTLVRAIVGLAVE